MQEYSHKVCGAYKVSLKWELKVCEVKIMIENYLLVVYNTPGGYSTIV
jgi:hypothetical protein